MMRRLLPVLVLSFVTAGCDRTIITPGAEGLSRGQTARIVADSHVFSNTWTEYTVPMMVLDGVPYWLDEKPATLVLAPGRHTVNFSYEPFVPTVRSPGTRYCFEAAPGTQYRLVSTILGSAGMSHQLVTPDGENVLKYERREFVPPEQPSPPVKQREPEQLPPPDALPSPEWTFPWPMEPPSAQGAPTRI